MVSRQCYLTVVMKQKNPLKFSSAFHIMAQMENCLCICRFIVHASLC